jgi:hypothetical protein
VEENKYLYAVSRRDLPPHQQAIQAAHAQVEYTRTRSDKVPEGVIFVWLTVEDKTELFNLISRLSVNDVDTSVYVDPDYEGYNPSALACLLTEHQRFLLSDLPLWKCPKPGVLNCLFNH